MKRLNQSFGLFPLGSVVATTGALEACDDARRLACLALHASGDWGCVSYVDAKENEHALKAGLRIISAHPLDPEKPCKGYGENCLWIITEADRSVTTFLLPSEY